MEGDPGDPANFNGNDDRPGQSPMTKAQPLEAASTSASATLSPARSASRIPVPIGDHGSRSATHLAGLAAGSLAGAGGPLPVLQEGGSGAASNLETPGAASRSPSDVLLDQCDHAPIDIRDSGDSAWLTIADEEPPPPVIQRPLGDADGGASLPLPPIEGEVHEHAPAAPSPAPSYPSVPSAPPSPGPSAAASPPPPHKLLVQAVCSRSQLAAASSGERLTSSLTASLPPGHRQLSRTSVHEHLPVNTVDVQSKRSGRVFDANPSDVFLSTSNSLEHGMQNEPPTARTSTIPELIVTAATPESGTPPDSHERVHAPAPTLVMMTSEAAEASSGAPPPPPPTPAQETVSPDRRPSPVAATSKKTAKVVAAPKTTLPKTTGKPPPGRRISTSNVGSVATASAASAAKDGGSVTLIKAPPGASHGHGVRPASARSVRSATTTPTVTTTATTSAKTTPASTRATSQGGNPTAASRTLSATVNRKASVTVKEPAHRMDVSAARPKSTHGPSTPRTKPFRELSSLSNNDGVPSKTQPKTKLQETKKPLTARGAAERVTKVSKDRLPIGAGEDVAELRTTSPADGGQEGARRVQEQLRGLWDHFMELIADLSTRHGVLLDFVKEVDPETHAEESRFAENLPHRKAEALNAAKQQTDKVVALVRQLMAEAGDMRALLEKENVDLVHRLAECTKDLEGERAASAKARAAKVANDAAVKQLRARVKELETKAEQKSAEDEAKLKEQAAQMHSLKEKLRARGVVLEQRNKDLEMMQAKVAELQPLEEAKHKLGSRLESVTQMLEVEAKTRDMAEKKLRVASERLSQIEMSRGDAELNEVRTERDQLKQQIEDLRQKDEMEKSHLCAELKKVMDQLEARSRQLEKKDAELRHYLTLKPGQPTREEMDKLKETFQELVTHNERLEQELSHSRQELAQRDKVMSEQEKVISVREKLIENLQARGPQWPREALDERTLVNLSATVDRKSVKIKAQEQTIQQLERQQESFQNLRTRMERRIAQLEHIVNELKTQAFGGKPTGNPRCNVAFM